MPRMLLGLAASAAAVIIAPAPASAERWSDPSFIAAASVAVHRGDGVSSGKNWGGQGHHSRRYRQWTDGNRGRHRDRGGRFDKSLFLGDYGYYEDNPAWQSEGYNDWWHDRPSRSMPRWTQNNQNCGEHPVLPDRRRLALLTPSINSN